MLQLPDRALGEKKEKKNFFNMSVHGEWEGLNYLGRGKYITSTDISPPSTGHFPAIPEYNLSPIPNLLILLRYGPKVHLPKAKKTAYESKEPTETSAIIRKAGCGTTREVIRPARARQT